MQVIIGLGDSWTVGEGSVSDLDENLNPKERIKIQNSNSWLTILKNKYYPKYSVINLAQGGFSNRAAIKNLYFLDTNIKNQITGGYLIFLLSSWDRFSFLNTDIQPADLNKFRTIIPGNSTDPIARQYVELVYSENSAVAETMLAIIEAQNYAKLHNLKFLFASSFDHRGVNDFKKFPVLLDQIDISKFLNNYTDYDSFNRLLYRYEEMYNVTLHAPCYHPTAEGYRIIADEMHIFMSRYIK